MELVRFDDFDRLERNGQKLLCPFATRLLRSDNQVDELPCGSWCPHFIEEDNIEPSEEFKCVRSTCGLGFVHQVTVIDRRSSAEEKEEQQEFGYII